MMEKGKVESRGDGLGLYSRRCCTQCTTEPSFLSSLSLPPFPFPPPPSFHSPPSPHLLPHLPSTSFPSSFLPPIKENLNPLRRDSKEALTPCCQVTNSLFSHLLRKKKGQKKRGGGRAITNSLLFLFLPSSIFSPLFPRQRKFKIHHTDELLSKHFPCSKLQLFSLPAPPHNFSA